MEAYEVLDKAVETWEEEGFDPVPIVGDYDSGAIFVPQSHSSYMTVVQRDGEEVTITMKNGDFERLARAILKGVWV